MQRPSNIVTCTVVKLNKLGFTLGNKYVLGHIQEDNFMKKLFCCQIDGSLNTDTIKAGGVVHNFTGRELKEKDLFSVSDVALSIL